MEVTAFKQQDGPQGFGGGAGVTTDWRTCDRGNISGGILQGFFMLWKDHHGGREQIEQQWKLLSFIHLFT